MKENDYVVISHQTVNQALLKITKALADAGIESAARDARMLIARAIGVPAPRLSLHLEDLLTLDHENRFYPLFLRRLRREPMSHILGKRTFWGNEIKVTPDVLDPRPDTETLIAAALERPFDQVLDLGTGSGCILLTLLAERENATGIGTDASSKALQVAEQNATALGVTHRCGFLQSDWWQYVTGQFDLIVSNPPYIAVQEMDTLQPELSYEPRMALTDEGDGLSCYRIIAAGAPAHLAPGGRLMVEIGPTQGAAVMEMFRTVGLENVQTQPDLDGRDRVVMGEMPQ